VHRQLLEESDGEALYRTIIAFGNFVGSSSSLVFFIVEVVAHSTGGKSPKQLLSPNVTAPVSSDTLRRVRALARAAGEGSSEKRVKDVVAELAG
jgi:hypothetical protein